MEARTPNLILATDQTMDGQATAEANPADTSDPKQPLITKKYIDYLAATGLVLPNEQ